MKKRNLLVLISTLFALLMILSTTGCSKNQETGNMAGTSNAWKPPSAVEVLVHSSPGGGHDVAARALAKNVQQHTDIPMNIINKEAGNGTVAKTEMAISEILDGSLIGQVDMTALTDNMTVEGVEYKRDSFRWVGILSTEVPHFSVSTKGKFGKMSFKEIIEYTLANPGKVNICYSGTWNAYETSRYLLEKNSGTKFNVVKIKGGNNAIMALLAGDVDICINYPTELDSYVKSGDLKIIALTDSKRSAAYPDAPTMIESGYNFSFSGFKAWVLPAKTSDEVYKGWCELFKTVMEKPETAAEFKTAKISLTLMQGDEMNKFLDDLDNVMTTVFNSDEYKMSLTK